MNVPVLKLLKIETRSEFTNPEFESQTIITLSYPQSALTIHLLSRLIQRHVRAFLCNMQERYIVLLANIYIYFHLTTSHITVS